MKRLLAITPFLLAACADAASPGDDLDAVPELALTEIFRAGSVEDPDAGFSAIGSMDVAADGTIYLFESQDRQIRAIGPDGRLLGRYGRRGEGPGEFSSMNFIGVLGDTLWALQSRPMSASRLALFTLDGRHVVTHTVNAAVRIPLDERRQEMLGPSALLRGGRLEGNMRISIGGLPVEGEIPAVGDTLLIPRVHFDLEGNAVDTLGFDVRVLEPPAPAGPTVRVEGTALPVPPPPNDEPRDLPVPDGRVSIHGPTPTGPGDAVITFTHVAFSGDTLAHRALHYTPRPYADAYLDSLAARRVRTAGNLVRIENGQVIRDEPPADMEAATRTVRNAIDFGPLSPPLAGVRQADDGAFWLQLQDDGGPLDRWLILAPDGEPRGRVTLPRNATIGWASGADLLSVQRDEFDVPWLVKYRIGEGG
jgi:hypothetical protein